jgi:ribosomal protein L33
MPSRLNSTAAQKNDFKYPHPFFRLDSYFMPPSIKELFRWIKAIFYGDAMVGSIVTKIAEYPVTNLIIDTENENTRKIWEYLFNDVLDIQSMLIQIGLDYFCFGNAFVSVYFPFTRWLECKSCGDRKNIEDVEYKVSGKVDFKTYCEKCGSQTAHKSDDVPLEHPQRINLVRFDPTNISVRYNPISGRSHYRYIPSSDIRRAVFQGEPEILNELPAAFIEAVRENKAVKLAPWNIFHFKRPTLAEGDMGWGKPLILHSMKRVFYLNVLRKAQEQVAVEHIIPMDILFPTSSGPVNPFTHTNMAETRGHIENAIVRWRKDRNYKPVFPIPVGTARVGGDGRALLLGPEIDAVVAEIAAGMGVPREFVFGGLSWTGSSVSLRMLENHFLIYRRLMLRFVLWMKDMLRVKYRLPDVTIRFADFKMADDIQKKQLLLQLNAAQKVGTSSLLQELDMDPEKQGDEVRAEMSAQGETNELLMKAQAKAQGEALLVQTRYQARAQEIMAEEEVSAQAKQMAALETENSDQYAAAVAQEQAQRLQAEAQLQAMQMQLQEGGPMALMGGGAQPEEGAPAEEPQAEEMPAEEPQAEEMPAEEMPAEPAADQFSTPTAEQTLTIDPSRIASSYASRLQQMSPSDRALYSQHLRTNMPNLWGLMSEYMAPSASAPANGGISQQGL